MNCTGFFMLRKSSITERGFERTILSSVLYLSNGTEIHRTVCCQRQPHFRRFTAWISICVERQIVSGMDDELFSEDLELPTTHSEGNDVEHTA